MSVTTQERGTLYAPAGMAPLAVTVPTSDVTDPATFRLHFPAFANTTSYPDAQVQFWIDVSTVMCGPNWPPVTRQMGVELLTAHFLSLGSMAQSGKPPGRAGGVMDSKSVSKVSLGYDVNVTAMEGWGPFNYTIYGQQYAWLANLVGTGGIEMLSLGYGAGMAGIVWTWARGVLLAWGSG